MPVSIGDKLGPYEILAPIGAGGMGYVFRGRDTRLDRTVAIKVSKERFSERFDGEARAVAALNHPNICQLFDVGPDYLVMEYIDGKELKGPLPIDKAVEYASQILDALDAAHKKGITHRDLKPANILVTRLGIKLLDFGLAQVRGPLKETDATRALTSEGAVAGTLQYMSPEQLQAKTVDARSDLFSFGCVLYEMLTGKHAFEGQSAASVIAAILEREPAPLTVAPKLERIVNVCLAKDPDQRFHSAHDLKTAMLWSMEQRGASPRQRRWLWTAASIILLSTIAEGWAFFHFRQPRADERVLRMQIDPPSDTRFLTNYLSGAPSLSPDGRSIAFIASGKGKNGLWVRALDEVEARLIPGTENASYPFWSPDSKTVGFFHNGLIKRVDTAGTSAQTICETSLGRYGAWSKDGWILFTNQRTGLLQVPASGGTPTQVLTIDASKGERGIRSQQILPGGKVLIFSLTRNRVDSGIDAISLAKPTERVRILTSLGGALFSPGTGDIGHLLWMRGESLVVQDFNASNLRVMGEPQTLIDKISRQLGGNFEPFSISDNGMLVYASASATSQLTWLDRTGRSLSTVGEPAEYDFLRLSPDGRHATVVHDRALWMLDMDRGVSSRLSGAIGAMFPLWSADSRTVIYHLSNNLATVRKVLSGSLEQTIFQGPQTLTDWSRDGRLVLYTNVDSKSQRDLWVMPVMPDGNRDANAQPRLYLQTPFNEAQGNFSPEANPRWVAYQSDESGRDEIYVQSFPEPHGAMRISTDGGRFPQWSPNGRELFYISPENKLMSASLKIGEVLVEAAKPIDLFVLPADDTGFSPYSVGPDGQRFLVRVSSQQASPLTLIVNWPSLLKK